MSAVVGTMDMYQAAVLEVGHSVRAVYEVAVSGVCVFVCNV